MFGTQNYVAEITAQSRISDYQKFAEQQRRASFAKREAEPKEQPSKRTEVARPHRRLLGIFG